MKIFGYVRCAHEEVTEEKTQIECCRALAESTGYRLIEKDDKSQQEKILEGVSQMQNARLHKAVVTFRD